MGCFRVVLMNFVVPESLYCYRCGHIEISCGQGRFFSICGFPALEFTFSALNIPSLY